MSGIFPSDGVGRLQKFTAHVPNGTCHLLKILISTPEKSTTLVRVDAKLLGKRNGGAKDGLGVGSPMSPVVEEQLFALAGIIKGHQIGFAFDRAGCLRVHAAIKKGVLDLIKFAIQRHLDN